MSTFKGYSRSSDYKATKKDLGPIVSKSTKHKALEKKKEDHSSALNSKKIKGRKSGGRSDMSGASYNPGYSR